MFNRRRDDMFAVCLRRFANASNCKAIRLSPARRENDFVRARSDQSGDLPSRLIDGSARLLPEHVHARGVPKFVRQVRQHRLDDSGIDGRSGAMIEINSSHYN